MKKVLSITLAALCCVLLFASCGSNTPEETTVSESTSAEVTKAAEHSYTLTIDGQKKTGKTDVVTVGELLKKEGIVVGEEDTLTPSADAVITDGIEITLEKAKATTGTTVTGRVAENSTEASSERTAEEDSSRFESSYSERSVEEPSYSVPDTTEFVEPEPSATEPPASEPAEGGRTVVSRQNVADCDGSGHGYYIIYYSDGTTEYEDY